MNYYELIALPKYQQVIYLNGVRQLVADLAAMEEKDEQREFVDNSSFTRYLDLIDNLLSERASAIGPTVNSSCVRGRGGAGVNCGPVAAPATQNQGQTVGGGRYNPSPTDCPGSKKYTCKDMPTDAAAKKALRAKVYGAGKNAPKTCLIGGMWSTYPKDKAGAGKCTPQTTFKLASGKTLKCANKGDAICNPMLFGISQKGGQDAPICTTPSATMTYKCSVLSDNGSGAINVVNPTASKDSQGIDTAWNNQVANFQKLCGDKANDDVKTLNCAACKEIQAATYSLNFQVNKHSCDLDQAAQGADAATKKTLQ